MVVVVFVCVCVYVCVCVCVCVCVILQRTFLRDRSNESCIATTARHYTTQNWLDFCFKGLLSSYSMLCSP